MALIDDLEGLLGADAAAKLTPEMRSKLVFGEQLTNYYDGVVEEAPVRQPARAAQPNVVADPPPAAGLSAGLSDIEAMFDRKLGNIDERIKTQIETAVKPLGQELFNNAVSVSMRNTRELIHVENRHEKDFGEALDETKFNDFVNNAKTNGRNFSTVREAYDAYTAPRYTEKQIKDGVEEGLRQRSSGQNLPGSTPVASKGPVSILMGRKVDGSGGNGPDTAVGRAAVALQARMDKAANE